MAGTGQYLSIPPSTSEFIANYIAHTDTDFISPSGLCTGGSPGCALVAVYTPEQLGPLTGFGSLTLDESVAVGQANLDKCIRGIACTATLPPYTTTRQTALTDTSLLVFGESQSAAVATDEKAYLIAHPVTGKSVSFELVSNPNRPNGGMLERFVGIHVPIIGMTFDGATQTNSPQPTPLTTIDIARQYDVFVDFPNNPLNVLADLNAILGGVYYHGGYRAIDAPPLLQGYFQDTTYYLEPSSRLPLLEPLALIPIIGPPLAAVLDAPLRVLIESAYDRTINPGQPTPAQYLYFPNPIKTLIDFAIAIPTGWDDAIALVTGDPSNRPFHTSPQPVYGVGGPPVYAGAIDPYGPVDPSAGASLGRRGSASSTAVSKPSLAGSSARPARLPRGSLVSRQLKTAGDSRVVQPRACAGTCSNRGHGLRNRSTYS